MIVGCLNQILEMKRASSVLDEDVVKFDFANANALNGELAFRVLQVVVKFGLLKLHLQSEKEKVDC